VTLSYRNWLASVGVITLVLLAGSILIGKLLISPIYNPDLLKIEAGFTTVIVGASHSEASFHPDYFPRSVIFAESGEPLFYTYYKLKNILRVNRHINRIILAYSPIHLSKYQDNNLFTGSAGARKFLMSNYIFFGDENDKHIDKFSFDYLAGVMKFDLGVPLNYMDDIKHVFQYYIKKDTDRALYIKKGHDRLSGSHLIEKDVKDKADYYFYNNEGDTTLSEAALDAFDKIVALANKKNIELVIVNTPSHEKFRKYIPAYNLISYRNKINENIKKIRYFDLSNLNIPDDEFYDGDHLNEQGSIRFSKYLKTLLAPSDGTQ